MNLCGMVLVWLAAASQTAVSSGADSSRFAGEGTSYGNSWQGHNCGFTDLWSFSSSKAKVYFAALNAAQYDQSAECGRCVHVECTSSECASGKPVTLLITDQCPGCKYGDVDMSDQAFLELTGSHPSRFKIEWSFVTCPTDFIGGNLEIYLKDGSNGFWFAFQPRSSLKKVVNMVLKSQGKTIQLAPSTSNGIEGFFFLGQDGSGLTGDFTLELTSDDGETIVDHFNGLWASGTSRLSGGQFSVQNMDKNAGGNPSLRTSVPVPITTLTQSPSPRDCFLETRAP